MPYLDNPSEEATSKRSQTEKKHETVQLVNEVQVKNTYNLNKSTEHTSV